MSEKALRDLASKLDASLKKNSEEYRAVVSDFMPHRVKIDETEIKKEARKQLRLLLKGNKRTDISPELEAVIEEEVPKLCKKLYDSFDPKKFPTGGRRAYLVTKRTGNPKSFTFRLAAKEGTSRNVFAYFRRAKQRAQREFLDALDDVLKEQYGESLKETQTRKLKSGGTKEVQVRSQFLAVGHADATAVATQRALKSQKIYTEWLGTIDEDLKDLMKEEFGNLFVKVTKGPGTRNTIANVQVSLESDLGNKSKAFTDAARAGNLEKALQRLAQLELKDKKLANLKASDSPLEVVEKKMLNMLHETGSSKRRKTNIKKQKINNSKGQGKSKPKRRQKKKPGKYRGEAVIVGKGLRSGGGKKRQGATAKPGPSNLRIPQLIGVLNRDLPSTVEKNMGFPALESQSGRFASSPRVTDILKTPSGFPSIGYTYQKNPYQTFEVGYRQGSPDRDPRKIIDMSIREIALQFALGRFYTRRV